MAALHMLARQEQCSTCKPLGLSPVPMPRPDSSRCAILATLKYTNVLPGSKQAMSQRTAWLTSAREMQLILLILSFLALTTAWSDTSLTTESRGSSTLTGGSSNSTVEK